MTRPSRRALLSQIRDFASRQWASYSHFVNAAMYIRDEELADRTPHPSVMEQRDRTDKAWREEQEQLFQLLPQIGDTQLRRLIDTYLVTFDAAMPPTTQITTGATSPEDSLTKLRTARNQLFDVNKRIEELLTGADPT